MSVRMKRALAFAGIAIAALLLYLALWPVPIDPIAWEPPSYDANAWKPTGTVATAERIAVDGTGPEDLEVDQEGRIYAGVEDGRILLLDPSGKPLRELANTGGRPLGMHWAKDGRLLVADANRGLLAIDAAGRVAVLTTTCAGAKLVFTDDVDVAADGTVYFTDASVKYGVKGWKLDIVESRPNGKLCTWDPKTYQTSLVLGDMYFANGVAIDPEQQFVLVNETSRYRVRKVWIAGEKAGQNEMLIENLPGFPDNISTGSNGVFWIAIGSPRNAPLDSMAGSPFLRKVTMRLPEALQPQPEKTARTIGIDENGKIIADLFDPQGEKVFMVTAVVERKGQLYFGSLRDSAFARMPVP
jgi:sugar lactone lactonase YvrE